MLGSALQRVHGPQPAGESQRRVVEQIRSRYIVRKAPKDGIASTDVDEQNIQFALLNQRTIANAARLLSKELYTKDDHVVLELVQNADDCSYAPDVQPSFRLILFDKGLLIATNEKGFTERNVTAICDLGSSSKSRSLGAFTGEKGIGFKAVAIISQATYIDSGGFKFFFDIRKESYADDPELQWLGLVCPTWIEDLSCKMEDWVKDSLTGVEGVDAARLLRELDGFGTAMWLDLKPDCDRKRLAQQLSSISPFMLLNLRQLRHMRVLIATPGCCNDKHIAYAEHNDVITLTERQGSWGDDLKEHQHHLLRLVKTVEVPQHIEKSEEKRGGVKEVGLMFALPMEDDGMTAKPDTNAGVFAFLPVRSYGFRFNIQADFVLPSSREDILEGRPWNKWLRDELAPAFVGKVMEALSAGTLTSAALLQFLPLPGDVQGDFMGEAADGMLRLLRSEPCVLTAAGEYCKPASLLLPDPLLQLSSGQQLISNERLAYGLPGRQYVHQDLLASSTSSADDSGSSDRAQAVLQQLGAKCISADLLVQWLTADGTGVLLAQQEAISRKAWLQDLYMCLHRLIAQPASSPLSMAAEQWGEELATAPILLLHGEGLTSYSAAQSRGRLFLWDPMFGTAADASLFISMPASTSSGSSGSSTGSGLLLVDPTFFPAHAEAESVLRHFFRIDRVPMSALVDIILKQQEDAMPGHDQNQQQLLFLMRNRQHLGAADWKKLQARLRLRAAAAADAPVPRWRAASELRYPCSCAGMVPPELQDDCMQAGVKFLHPWFGQLLHAGIDRVSADDARSFLNTLGVQELPAHEAVEALLMLYRLTDSMQAIRFEQHLRHLRFMAGPTARAAVLGLQQEISTGLRLYSSDQNPASERPKHAAKHLFAPLSGSLGSDIMSQMTFAGAQFVHGCYAEAALALVGQGKSAPPADLMEFLKTTVGVQAGADAVVTQLLMLHTNSSALNAKAAEWAKQAHQGQSSVMLVQQLQFIATHRADLTTEVQQQCRQQLYLLSSDKALLNCSNLMLPPTDDSTRQVLQDLINSGSNLRILSSCYAPLWEDAESKLVLTKMLGLQQADARTAIASMIAVHSQHKDADKPVTGNQLLQHLQYLKQYQYVLETDAWLCKRLQQALVLQDTDGRCTAAADLFFPLDSKLAQQLQQDVRTAGMRILHSQFDADLHDLLQLLGVKKPKTKVVAGHILQLYSTGKGQEGVSEQQRAAHLTFFADNLQLLADNNDLLQKVREQLQLQDSAGVYRAPAHLHYALDPQFANLEQDMVGAGMRFLNSSYAAAAVKAASTSNSNLADTTHLQNLQQLLTALGVATADAAVVAQYILRLYKHDGQPAATAPEHHLRHLRFFADNISMLQGDSNLLKGVQEQVLLQDSVDLCRQAKDLSFSLGQDTADLQADMLGAGMHFVNSMYSVSALKPLLRVLGVQKPDKLRLARYIIQLHKNTDASIITEQQRSRHLAFLADIADQLEGMGSLLEEAQQHVHLMDLAGDYVAAKRLWFPLPAATACLEADLMSAGMCFLHKDYSALPAGSADTTISSKDKRLLRLLEMLRVDHPGPSDIAKRLVRLHEANSESLSEAQRRQHLAFFAVNLQLFSDTLRQRLRKAMQLLDSKGQYRPADDLLFPLKKDMVHVQNSMDTAGMPFLHSSYLQESKVARANNNMLQLLFELGVTEPNAEEVTSCILQLYQQASGNETGPAQSVAFDEHMTHLQFLCSRWHELGPAMQTKVCQQLQLRMQPGCSRDLSTTAASDRGCPPVYLLPPKHSMMYAMLPTMQLGGGLFLSEQYSTDAQRLELKGGVRWQDLEQWLRAKLGACTLSHEAAADLILSAHDSGRATEMCTKQELIQQGLFVAAVTNQLSNAGMLQDANSLAAKAKQHMQLVLHPSAPCQHANQSEDAAAADDASFHSQTASEGLLYWPAVGAKPSASWQLQDILLPSDVAYINAGYVDDVQQVPFSQEMGVTTAGMQRFFTQQLGLQAVPVPGSAELQTAVDAGDRWEPLLLMLSDIWGSYRMADQQQQLQALLRNMQVAASCGTTPLHRCFVPTQDLGPELVALLSQLQLPILHLPAHCSWTFLQRMGVSTRCDWPMLLKALQQLSAAQQLTESDADLAAMQRLYEQVLAQALQSAEISAKVTQCFQQQPLVFVPVKSKKAFWVTSKDVMWSGSRKIFPYKIFIASLYKTLEQFFCTQLGVKSTTADDLKGALEHMAQRPVAEDTEELYLTILKGLAAEASELAWLPNLLQQPVLLAKIPDPSSIGFKLQFVAASEPATAPYLPDRKQYVDLFGQHCSLLAVPAEEVPALQPLLDLVKPPLHSLSNSITRNVTMKDPHTEAQPDEELTLLVQETFKLAARFVYKQQPQHYMQLLESDRLQQLAETTAYSAPGLVETLTLVAPDGRSIVSKQTDGIATVSEVPAVTDADADAVEGKTDLIMLVNTASSRGDQQMGMASQLAEQLCGNSCGSMSETLADLIELLLRYTSERDLAGAERKLEQKGAGHIPQDKRPWLLPEEAAAATGSAQSAAARRKEVWADDGEDVSDTGSSAEYQAQQLAAMQVRACSVAEQRRAQEMEQESSAAAAVAAVGGAAATAGALGIAAAAAAAAAAVGSATAGAATVGGAAAAAAAAALGGAAAAEAACAADYTAQSAVVIGSSSSSSSSSSGAHGSVTWASADAAHDRAPAGDYSVDASSPSTPYRQGVPVSASHSGSRSYARGRQYSNSTSGSSYRPSGGHSSVHYTQRMTVHQRRSLRLTEGGFAYAGPAETSRAPADDDSFAEMMQQALSAGAAAGRSGSFSSLLRSTDVPLAARPALPTAPGFVSCSSSSSSPMRTAVADTTEGASIAAACNASSSVSMQPAVGSASSSSGAVISRPASSGPGAGEQGVVRVTRSTEVCQDVIQTVSKTISFDTGSRGGSFHGGGGYGGFSGRSNDMVHAERTGAAGEVFLFGRLKRELPDFNETHWHSSNRIHLPGMQLQPPNSEPSFDFLYEDTTGKLTGDPGTLCYIECKATAADLQSGGRPLPMPITPNEWALAQAVHRRRLSGEKVQYILFRVDKVGESGGPRIAAVLHDPVQMLAEGKVTVTGGDLSIGNYPLLLQ